MSETLSASAMANQARLCHEQAMALADNAEERRQERNELIRNLRSSNAVTWTYVAIAEAVGCSKELIAAVCQGRV